MRVFLVTLLCLLAIGCNSDPRCRRETAILRAELVDLEDKYYLLKSQHEELVGGIGYGSGSEEIIGEPFYTDGGVIYEGAVIHDGGVIHDGEVIYDGGVIHDGGAIHDGGVIYTQSPTEPNHPAPPSASSLSINQNNIQNAEGSTYRASPTPAPPKESIVRSRSTLPVRLPEMEPDTDLADAADSRDSQSDLSSSLMLNGPDTKVSFSNSDQSDATIASVMINPSSTRGHDVDGAPGDEGIDLLIQPRTSDGNIALQAGELTVSIIDPAESPTRQRIGLWKFLPEETKLFFANTELGSRGILLHLPWDQSTPVNERLVIHVRFITPDSRVLKTSAELRIQPPSPDYRSDDPAVAGWTLRDPRWIPNADQVGSTGIRSEWRPSTSPTMQASKARKYQGSVDAPAVRRKIQATPAKATINNPAWRPIR